MSDSATAIGDRAEQRGAVWPWPRVLAAVIFAVMGTLVLATFQDYGISWDEQLQNSYGQKLLAYYTSGFQDRSAFSYINLFLYGGFFDLTAAVANLISPFDEYATRHLLGGLIFLSGLLGGWLLTRLLAGERAALIALACLATTPLLYGHGFINPKDSPLAWLAIWTTYFACRFLDAREQRSWGVAIGFGISLGLALGTRVIAIAYLDYLAAVLVVAVVARYLQGAPPRTIVRQIKTLAMPIGCALLLAIVTMAITWPWSVQAPFNIYAALNAFTHFAFYPLVLWNGEMIRADVMPWHYLPGLLAFQLPEYVLIGAMTAGLFGIAALRRGIITTFARPRAQQYLFMAMSVGVPLAAYLVMQPTVYNGIRHFLFVVPPLVILAAIGLDKLLTYVTAKHRGAALVMVVLLLAGFGRQIVIMASLHPYEYVAYNSLVSGVRGAENQLELDYWGTSLAEASHALANVVGKNPTLGLSAGKTVRVFVCGDTMSAAHYLPKGIEVTEVLSEADFYMGMTGVACRDLDESRGRVVEIKRAGATLAYVLDLQQQPHR